MCRSLSSGRVLAGFLGLSKKRKEQRRQILASLTLRCFARIWGCTQTVDTSPYAGLDD